MIDIKKAVKAAEQHLHRLFDKPPSVQLEEVYLADDERAWFVTLSFVSSAPEEDRSNRFQRAILGDDDRLVRKYKTFEVDSESGQVRSMKIRPVPSV